MSTDARESGNRSGFGNHGLVLLRWLMLSHHVALLDFELLFVQMCGPSMIVRVQCEQTPGQCLFCAHITGESAYPDFDSEAQTRPDGAIRFVTFGRGIQYEHGTMRRVEPIHYWSKDQQKVVEMNNI